MIWRDGHRLVFEHDGYVLKFNHCLDTNIKDSIIFWIETKVNRGDPDFDMHSKVFHFYQSFLLDYISYLFESAIDRQLALEECPIVDVLCCSFKRPFGETDFNANPVKSDIGVLNYIRENPDDLPVLKPIDVKKTWLKQNWPRLLKRPGEHGYKKYEPGESPFSDFSGMLSDMNHA